MIVARRSIGGWVLNLAGTLRSREFGDGVHNITLLITWAVGTCNLVFITLIITQSFACRHHSLLNQQNHRHCTAICKARSYNSEYLYCVKCRKAQYKIRIQRHSGKYNKLWQRFKTTACLCMCENIYKWISFDVQILDKSSPVSSTRLLFYLLGQQHMQSSDQYPTCTAQTSMESSNENRLGSP